MTVTSQDVPGVFPSGNPAPLQKLSLGAIRALGDPSAGIPKEALISQMSAAPDRSGIDPYADNMGSSRYGGG